MVWARTVGARMVLARVEETLRTRVAQVQVAPGRVWAQEVPRALEARLVRARMAPARVGRWARVSPTRVERDWVARAQVVLVRPGRAQLVRARMAQGPVVPTPARAGSVPVWPARWKVARVTHARVVPAVPAPARAGPGPG